jgi:shikimate kinase
MFLHREGAIFRPLDNSAVIHRPVFLTGFMCSGKTRVGRELAQLLGRTHVDLDREVERETGPLVPFFQTHGEAAFRELEARTLKDLAQRMDVVVSTGGGTAVDEENLQLMLEAGTVIWLDVPLNELMDRIQRAGMDRPLLFGFSGDVLQQRVEELLAAREPWYSRAHMIVQAGASPPVVAERIRDVLSLQDR